MIKPLFAGLFAGCLCAALPAIAEEAPALAANQQLGYALGQDLGKSLQTMGIAPGDIDIEAFGRGMGDLLQGSKAQMSEEEMIKVKEAFFAAAAERQMAQLQAQGEKNLHEMSLKPQIEKEFFAANAKKAGVKSTASGLQYRMLTVGKGKQPTATSKVTVHYRGRLLDGSEFDSSYARNQPATFPLNRVIPGWTEGVPLMREGGKAELYVPAKLAYGENGFPPKIAPNSPLIFEVELLKVE